jgi:ABC-type lipoprotein release transport system permease subunit
VQINGVVPQQEYQISLLKKKIIEGNLFDSSRKNEIMIGKKLAGKMKLHIGSKLVLTFTDTSATIVSGAFRVIAIYKSDNAPLDEKNVYIKMDDLNEMLGLKNNFHEIVVLLDKDEYLQEIQEKLLTLFPTIQTETWIELSPETDLLVKTTNEYSYIIMIIIMTALAFGIVNTMLMAIMERIREIGMMVALGTVRIRIFLMVLLETIFLTLAGTPIGLLIGWLVTNYFYNHGLDLSGMGKELMSSFGFGTTIYPEFPFERLPGIFIIVTMTAILSSIFPAIKALRMQPADALRK